MIREEIKKLIEKAIGESISDRKISIQRPPQPELGDYAAILGKEARGIFEEIKKLKEASEHFKKIEFKPPVFINFFLKESYLQKELGEILRKKDKFGDLDLGQGKRVQVEFISANPTGPLTLGNGRGGFWGDVLANVFSKAGYYVEREYYINDIGEQIKKLGHSVIGDSEAVYKGRYIEELRKKIKGDDALEVGEKAAEVILEEMIKPAVAKMGIRFDKWFSEKSLHESGEVEKVLEFLKKKRLSYEKDGALWFLSTRFGDDKDRVLVKSNGEKTYFASDIAYLKNKIDRGFDILFCFLGADHFGYLRRIKAAAQALGYNPENLRIIIMQLVRLFENGREVKMSKRSGIYVTIDELIDEVGVDVARFFFLERAPNTHLNFDLNLAKEKSEKNPVYYVQYAYARICSILRKLKESKAQGYPLKKLSLLTHPAELKLIKNLVRFPEIVEDCACDLQLQRIPHYAKELAASFHQFYTECYVLTEKEDLREARLALVSATKIVLKNTLDLMGISAQEKM